VISDGTAARYLKDMKDGKKRRRWARQGLDLYYLEIVKKPR
jgi:hypothetical protein